MKIHWTTVRDDSDQGYVREYEDGALKITYGPMPCGILGTFAKDRRDIARETMERLLR